MEPSKFPPEIGFPPSPDGGWSAQVQTLQNATVVPPIESALIQECGVIDAQGNFCEHASTWRGSRQMMIAPTTPPMPATMLKGRHLFAGQLWAHFGHYMAESLSRLWALDHVTKKPDSIIFIPKRPNQTTEVKSYQREFLDLLGIDIPITVIKEPTEIETLITPGQGFGLGDISQGTKEFRDYFAQNFAQNVAPIGPKKIYLSRSELGGLEGGVVMETQLENNLQKQGYEILHPQHLTIAQQVAHYRAASHIVGLDGSAFHLLGFVGNNAQKVAVVLRRNSNVFQNLHTQIEQFTGAKPIVINVVQADWIPEHRNRPGRYSFGQLDFETLGETLATAGFIANTHQWEAPRFRDTKKAMKAFGDRKGTEYIRVKKGQKMIVRDDT